MPRPELDELPQRFPFRFVDRVLSSDPRDGLEAAFDPSQIHPAFRGLPWIPEACVLEGVAQAAVIWFVRAVAPLEPWEVPLVGHLAFTVHRRVWWDETLRYRVRPVRTLSDRAVFDGEASGDRGVVATGRLTVAKRAGAALP